MSSFNYVLFKEKKILTNLYNEINFQIEINSL